MSEAPVDLLVTGARLWTDGETPSGADTLAILGNRIAAVGRKDDLRRLVGSRTRRIDAAEATVTPGLWDAHLHLLPWARSRAEVDLAGAASVDEACERVTRGAARQPGDGPLIGRGWSAERWGEPPRRGALDPSFPARAVLLHSHDFHALWVNSRALADAGITRETRDPPGGLIERGPDGAPSGVVRENAVKLFATMLERGAEAAGEPAELLASAARELHALGVTAIQDFERGAAAFNVMERFARGPGPKLRVLQCVGPEDLDRVVALGLASGAGDEMFRVGPLKLFADGTLNSRTAAMLEPFEGTASRGLEVLPPADLEALVERGLSAGFAVAIHAIGDRACRNALDAFERARLGPRTPRAALPSRIEHAQLVDPADVSRFATLGVAASMQPLHCTSDAAVAERAWGSRIRYSYPWRTLLDSGALLAFGSDAPVEPPSVAEGLGAACTRRRADGTPRDGFVPAQRIGLGAALRAYTEGPARLAGLWPRCGSLRAGSLADLVVWDRDLFAADPERLHEARPSCTVCDGVVVHGPRGGS
ncbi:MAG TPA: amidohydrolase [Candidatus Udaeobacter sp.]|jgi:predicted amidohydrolase YtcJ|nr:amidohydrolase [Candidatus Udaeobacter sp.]